MIVTTTHSQPMLKVAASWRIARLSASAANRTKSHIRTRLLRQRSNGWYGSNTADYGARG